MKDQLVLFKTANLAKEKGFDWETEVFYSVIHSKKPYTTKGVEYMSDSYVRWWRWNSNPGNYPTIEEEVLCAAPTQTTLQRWLRDVHNIDVWAQPFVFNNHLPDKSYSYFIYKDGSFVGDAVDFLDFEEALETGLHNALNKCI